MTSFIRTILAARLPLVAAGLALLTLGCGGDQGYRVSGKVTFKGQPIPVGKIYFNPDGSKGNTGPSGYANIKDGQYDTSAEGGRGFVGGPVVISIEGFDPNTKGDKIKGDTSGEVTIKSLFPRYEIAAELPKSSNTKDIDVPAEAANAPVEKGPAKGAIVP